jgi:hypothetical protein
MPLWNCVRSAIAIDENYQTRWAVPLMLIVAVTSLTVPLFYYCLSSNHGTLQLSRRMQSLCSAGVLALVAAVVIALPMVIRPFVPQDISVLTHERTSWTIADLSNLITLLSNVVYALPLIALSAMPRDISEPQHSASRLLRVVATTVTIVGGLIVSLLLLRLVLMPLTYPGLRDAALQIGRTPPKLGTMVGESAWMALEQFGLFVAPYVVWRSTRRAGPIVRD